MAATITLLTTTRFGPSLCPAGSSWTSQCFESYGGAIKDVLERDASWFGYLLMRAAAVVLILMAASYPGVYVGPL